MKFCQSMLEETVELLCNNRLPYRDTILIGQNASGKSEALKRYMIESNREIYFIDAVNRGFQVRAIKPFKEEIKYTRSILKMRMNDEYFNMKDSWSYYGTTTECIELLYLYYEKELQRLLKKYFGLSFSVYSKETQEVKYDFGDIGKISTGYQAIVRIILELLYFKDVNPVQNEDRAVIVIDEIDEYISPNNAGKLYSLLKDHFQKMDFIITTHSAEILVAASNCNIIVLHEDIVEILDADDFQNIDDAMLVFKSVFGRNENKVHGGYEDLLRKLFNNRVSGIWGENEEMEYAHIQEDRLTNAEKVLYRQIGEW